MTAIFFNGSNKKQKSSIKRNSSLDSMLALRLLLSGLNSTNLMQELKSIDFRSITCDCWQSNSQNCYLSVTCHFIDQNFVNQKRVLALSFIEESKSTEQRCDQVLSEPSNT